MNQFVSRGGIKLQHAIENFKLKIKNFSCLDVGSSTGGFVDCLLQNGAAKIYSVDTSYGELAWKLRNDPRVVVMERTNILHLPHLEGGSENTLDGGEVDKVDLITIDAGWTKLELVLPVVRKFLKKDGIIIALLKPQYEAFEQQRVKGVVKDEELEEVVNSVKDKIHNLSFNIVNSIESPILGSGGNREYLLLISDVRNSNSEI
ncbi:TlyA family rRNA (cytidine-2'-O)-methyltransferase [Candidatus Daviesbacteria bacterium]|nr:TlyA family rRNA (cytidine-2'-O)-methyltransferase [Candidatus Daviesbacteria bacterium]